MDPASSRPPTASAHFPSFTGLRVPSPGINCSRGIPERGARNHQGWVDRRTAKCERCLVQRGRDYSGFLFARPWLTMKSRARHSCGSTMNASHFRSTKSKENTHAPPLHNYDHLYRHCYNCISDNLRTHQTGTAVGQKRKKEEERERIGCVGGSGR